MRGKSKDLSTEIKVSKGELIEIISNITDNYMSKKAALSYALDKLMGKKHDE